MLVLSAIQLKKCHIKFSIRPGHWINTCHWFYLKFEPNAKLEFGDKICGRMAAMMHSPPVDELRIASHHQVPSAANNMDIQYTHSITNTSKET